MRILIAGEDQTLAKFVREGLEGENYSVDVFNTASRHAQP